MIDPENITNYNLTVAQLEEHLLFWIFAAGKNGRIAAKNLEKVLKIVWPNPNSGTPFDGLRRADSLYDIASILQWNGVGCYNNKARTIKELIWKNFFLNLRTCSVEDLEKIYGIGMKTSRCFIIHSRKGARYAGLDTHILKFLKQAGVDGVPKATPSSKKQYLRLEKEFLGIADNKGVLPADLDLQVWNEYSVKAPLDKREMVLNL